MAASAAVAPPNKRLKTGNCSDAEIRSVSTSHPNIINPPDLYHPLTPYSCVDMSTPIEFQQQENCQRQILVDPSQNPYATIVVDSGLDMDEINRNMFFNPSERQTVSCGTAAVDLKRGRILSLFNKKLGIAQLPKGRKQIGEGHLEAGLRETLEESGVLVRPLALKVGTRSSAIAGDGNGGGRIPDTDVVSDVFNNEFIGVVRYPDPQSQTPGTLKSIYWFAAEFDMDNLPSPSPSSPTSSSGGLGLRNIAPEDKFIVCAYGVQDTIDHLRFDAEKDVVRKLVADLEASGIKIGSDCGDGGSEGIPSAEDDQ